MADMFGNKTVQSFFSEFERDRPASDEILLQKIGSDGSRGARAATGAAGGRAGAFDKKRNWESDNAGGHPQGQRAIKRRFVQTHSANVNNINYVRYIIIIIIIIIMVTRRFADYRFNFSLHEPA